MSAAQMGACAMANQSRKKGGKRAFGKTLIRLFFVLMLLSMLAAYISNQVTEWVARDSYNYAAPNERIFVDVTGK